MSQSLFSQHSHWHRLRWQLSWGLVAALLPPAVRLASFGIPEHGQSSAAFMNAFWAGALAILLGLLLIRNVGRYPGVEKASAIIPSFSASFGVMVVIFLMLRLDYSRGVLAGAYGAAIIIFYLGYSQVFGRKKLMIGYLPMEDSGPRMLATQGVRWVPLEAVDERVQGLEAIAVDLRNDLSVEWERRLADFALAGIPVYHSKHLIESLTGRVELEHLSETSFGTLSPSPTYMFVKQAIDYITALLALVLLSPFLVLLVIAIRLDSPGPAIFRQTRIGFRGLPFVVYKFRTMHPRSFADDARHEAITQDNDNRITRIGRLLRKTRIDELPQIINVLKGQMSWIGPRPEADVLSSWYEAEIPFYRYRHVVRPGITGWAQVMQGHVADVTEVRSKLYYDFYYIKNFSFWIDSLIVIRTAAIMFSGFGAK